MCRHPPTGPINLLAIAELHDALAAGGWAGAAAKKAARELETAMPGAARRVRLARVFHARAAKWAVEDGAAGVVFAAGGYPCAPPLHTAAAEASPDARFVYASSDAGIAAVLRGAVAGPRVSVAEVSARHPETLLTHPAVRDCDGPLSVHLHLCCHFWSPGLARDVIGTYARLLPPRSTLVMSSAILGDRQAAEWSEAVASPVYRHSAAGIHAWLEEAGMSVAGHGVRDVPDRPRVNWALQILHGGRRGTAGIVEAVARVP
jgi:S-adenosyl methyltransferase